MSAAALELALDLLRRLEGLRLEAYRDEGGTLTIGYGHTGPDVRQGQKISEAEAERLLLEDARAAQTALRRLVTAALSPEQEAALISWLFNVGRSAAARSTLLSRLNAGDQEAVPELLRRWVHVNGRPSTGLVRRREAEIALWQRGTPRGRPRSIAEAARTDTGRGSIAASLGTAGGGIAAVASQLVALDWRVGVAIVVAVAVAAITCVLVWRARRM